VLLDLLSGRISIEQAYFLAVGLLLAITFHEAAHAFVADRLGDPTPRYQGRLTLNPLAHLDPLGTLLFLVARFGWGKPVVFNPLALKNPALGAALISLAGPLTNFTLALLACLLIRASIQPLELWVEIAFINIVLGVFNLIPVAPLDGEKVVTWLIPPEMRATWLQIQSYGIFLLIFVIISGGPLILSVVSFIFNLFSGQQTF
jgi:Zn-dependent protease